MSTSDDEPAPAPGDDGTRRPTRYWTAPLAASAATTTAEPLPPIPDERGTARRVGRYVGVGVLAVLATVGWVMGGRKTAGPPHTITIPASVDGYDRLTGSVADRTVDRIRQAAADAVDGYAPAADKMTIAVYERSGRAGRRLTFMAFTAKADARIDHELRTHSAAHEADEIFRGRDGFSNAHDVEPGRFGGVLRCGTGNPGNPISAMCVWADGSTLGVFQASKTTADDLAATALDFRDTAEH